jgi:hypothetical protein
MENKLLKRFRRLSGEFEMDLEKKENEMKWMELLLLLEEL